jgi:hypothetical protein
MLSCRGTKIRFERFGFQAAAFGAVGAGTKGDTIVLGIAALFLATAASTDASPAFTLSSPWWDRITYTIAGDGDEQSCRYESSIDGAEACDSDGPPPQAADTKGSASSFTKITIERRFNPDRPSPPKTETGDTLLGQQVMSLAFDEKGAVSSCKIVGQSGQVKPFYGCDEARAERFEASASSTDSPVRYGFMTILVYGHEEYLA